MPHYCCLWSVSCWLSSNVRPDTLHLTLHVYSFCLLTPLSKIASVLTPFFLSSSQTSYRARPYRGRGGFRGRGGYRGGYRENYRGRRQGHVLRVWLSCSCCFLVKLFDQAPLLCWKMTSVNAATPDTFCLKIVQISTNQPALSPPLTASGQSPNSPCVRLGGDRGLYEWRARRRSR